MKTTEQIEEKMKELEKIFRDETGEHFSDYPFSFAKYCYSQAQKDLLAEASEGFEEWENTVIQNNGGVDFPDFIEPEEVWQAARLSMMKEKMK